MPAIINPPPIRTPLFTRDGQFAKPWVIWWQQVLNVGVLASDSSVEQSFNDDNRSDPLEAINQAAALSIEPNARDWASQIDEAQALGFTSDRSAQALAEIEDLKKFVSAIQEARLSSIAPIVVGTHAERISGAYPAGDYPQSLFWETDRTVFYLSLSTAGVFHWVYAVGTATDAVPADLGVDDVGFRYADATEKHTWEWSGTAWRRAPGDETPGMIILGGTTALGSEWALCDGSTVAINTDTPGTKVNVTTPDSTAVRALYTGTYAAGGQSGTPATYTPNDQTSAPLTSGVEVTATPGSGVFTAAQTHKHSAPALNVANSTNGGLPDRYEFGLYIRL